MITDRKSYSERHPGTKTFDELKRDISIIELATRYGYSNKTRWAREKSCAAYPCFENDWGDRIYIINPRSITDQKYFDISLSRKGDLIDFVRTRLDSVFNSYRLKNKTEIGAVNAVLHDYLGVPESERMGYRNGYEQNTPAHFSPDVSREEIFRLELFNLQPLTDTRYLQQNGIDPATIFSSPFEGRIYNVRNPEFREGAFAGYSKFVNTAFPYYMDHDGKIVGLEERNFNYKGHGITSQKSAGVWFSNPPAQVDHVYLCESGKDALSHYELHRPGNALYFSSGGQLTYEQIHTVQRILSGLSLSDKVKIHLAHDRDKSGAHYDLMYLSEAAAGLFPAIRRSSSKEYLSLSFGGTPDLVPFTVKLSTLLSQYNKPVIQLLQQQEHSEEIRRSLEKSMYRYEFAGGQLKVEIPRNYYGIQHFNEAFLKATDFGERIHLEKARLNDFNDDLKEKKGMYIPPPSLAPEPGHPGDMGYNQEPLKAGKELPSAGTVTTRKDHPKKGQGIS